MERQPKEQLGANLWAAVSRFRGTTQASTFDPPLPFRRVQIMSRRVTFEFGPRVLTTDDKFMLSPEQALVFAELLNWTLQEQEDQRAAVHANQEAVSPASVRTDGGGDGLSRPGVVASARPKSTARPRSRRRASGARRKGA